MLTNGDGGVGLRVNGADIGIAASSIADGTISTAKLVDGAVTLAKMANLATDKVIGRVTNSTGVPEAVSFGDMAQSLGAASGILIKEFEPLAAEFPGSNFPQVQSINLRPVLSYDASTDETAYWTFIAPQSFLTGTLSVVVSWMAASATSGAVRWQAAMEAVTSGDATDLDAATSFDTQDSAGTTVPGTAGYMVQTTITLTHIDSIAPGDLVRLAINRDADGTSGTDDATGDAHLLAVELRAV